MHSFVFRYYIFTCYCFLKMKSAFVYSGSPTYLEAPDFYLDFVFVSLGHRPKETTLPKYKWMFFHVRNFARVTFRRRA